MLQMFSIVEMKRSKARKYFRSRSIIITNSPSENKIKVIKNNFVKHYHYIRLHPSVAYNIFLNPFIIIPETTNETSYR